MEEEIVEIDRANFSRQHIYDKNNLADTGNRSDRFPSDPNAPRLDKEN
jgi:hypothetical protein